MSNKIIVIPNSHEIPGTELVRVTTWVINPNQTGFMGHLVIHQSSEASFWDGVIAAREAATSMDEKLLTDLDPTPIIEACPEAVNDGAAYGLGVKAAFGAWQPSLTTEDSDYWRRKFFIYEEQVAV